MLKVVGLIVGIAIAVLLVWWLVDMAWYLWGGMGALIFGFLLVFFLVYLADRRKVKESQDLIAEAEKFS